MLTSSCWVVATLFFVAVHSFKVPNAVHSISQLKISLSKTDSVPISVSDGLKTQAFKASLFASSVSSILLLEVFPRVAMAAGAAPEGFITTESGLQYRDIVEGTGDKPVPGDMVRVHYTGWLDGFDSPKKFDSSYDRRSPLGFKVGTRMVIAGWDEGILTNLKVGGKRELIIPASLGYGVRGAGGVIPPNATLYFRIELVGLGAKANR